MSWEQVCELHRQGFIIGSHSVNHIDCAAESEDVVREELEGSRDKLKEQLGLQEIYFAYPYGGRQNMTPERLRLVKQTGYKACLSAYGGANVGQLDPYDVRRVSVNWEVSDRALRYLCSPIW
jgi:peptidoglycan/xylan/chitin deacetylase (PgdA/CDA1 family)